MPHLEPIIVPTGNEMFPVVPMYPALNLTSLVSSIPSFKVACGLQDKVLTKPDKVNASMTRGYNVCAAWEFN